MDDKKSFSSGKHKSGTLNRRSRSQFDNGKRKKHNSSHDSSFMTAKAIETVYRILCPAKKIGSVLGKGGEIVNALRDDTHAKIRVAEAIPGAEERVIIIFNYESNQPRSFDTDQDPNDVNLTDNEYEDMRLLCPAQDALLKVHDRIVADEYVRGGVIHENTQLDDAVSARILVPNNQIGCLLGKGGTTIQKLRSESGASIRILLAEHLPPCAVDTDELVQISGMPTPVKKALYEVSTLLHQNPRKENPPVEELLYASTQDLYRTVAPMPPLPQGNPMWSYPHPGAHATPPMPWFGGHRNGSSGYGRGSFNSSHVEYDGEMVEFSMRILCATGKIGGVIGKGGVTVRQLEQQTGAKIKVDDHDAAPEAEERVILVTSNEAPWDQISPTIEAVLQLRGKTNATSEIGVITTRILVPSSHVGCILGQGGNIITEIRRRTRADIQIFSKDEKPNYIPDKEELVQISGNPAISEEAFLEIASRLRARALRAGNADVYPAPSGLVHGFAPLESMPGRGLPSYGMIGPGNPVGYDHPKGTGPRHEAQVYPGAPTAAGYGAGPRREAQVYPGPPNSTMYGAGPRHDAQDHPGPPTATGYGAGPRHDAHGYPNPPTGAGPGREAPGYPGQPSATGYGAGPGREAPGYPGQPSATGYGAGPGREVPGYPGQPSATGYGAGTGREASGYPGQPSATGFGAGTGREASGYPGQPSATGYGTGTGREASGYPGQPSATGYGAGPGREASGYPGQPSATGYAAGLGREAPGYPGQPSSATGYGAGPGREAPGYPGQPSSATGYGAGPGREASGYPGQPNATGYGAGPRHESQGNLGQPTATGYGAGPRHEAPGYPSQPTATGYSAGPRHEAQSYPGSSTATGYSAGPRPDAQGYPGQPSATGYPNIVGSVEVKIPNSAVPSVVGTGGSKLSDIRKMSGARVKLNDPLSGASECVLEIHGTSDQMKAAQSLLQAFAASGGQNATPAPPQPQQARQPY